jgi:hypothetical protein
MSRPGILLTAKLDVVPVTFAVYCFRVAAARAQNGFV